MSRLDSIRKNGLIPERRHDAFLLALLLAVGLNVAFFAAQALLPHLAMLLQSLGVTPPVVQEEEFPFVLVDPSFLDEPEAPPPEDPAATAAVNREARQEENAPVPEAPEEAVYQPEGVEEQLSMAEGVPGEIDPGSEPAVEGEVEEIPEEEVEPVEEPEAPEEVPEAPIAEEPLEEPALPPEPEPVVEPLPEPEPEPAPEPEPIPEPEPEPTPDPVEELIDLAMLPAAPTGLFAPQPEPARAPVAPPGPEQFEPVPTEQPVETPPPVVADVPDPAAPAHPVRPQRRPRATAQNTPRPTFRRMDSADAPGGAPPRRNLTGQNVNLFDDPYMALLRDRYPEYMTKLGRQLQDSLIRTMFLYPSYYAAGESRILFRIAPDGTLGWFETQYPADGSDNTLRSITERTLADAFPFDPPPPAMAADPAFQRMSLNVYIY